MQAGIRTEVRPARPNDASMLSEFFLEAWHEAGPGAMGFAGATEESIKEIASLEFLSRRLSSPSTRIFVAQEGRKVIGFASVRLKEGREAELSGMVVLESAKGRGIGSRLLRKACDGARKRGCLRISVKTEVANARAIAFYKKAGFTESSRETARVGRTRIPIQLLAKKVR